MRAPEEILKDTTLIDEARNHFLSIFKKFTVDPDSKDSADNINLAEAENSDDSDGGMDMDVDEDEAAPERVLSKKQRKRQARLTVAQLKQLVDHPEVVEDHDESLDARLLVHLKSLRGTVPVPQHWSQSANTYRASKALSRVHMSCQRLLQPLGSPRCAKPSESRRMRRSSSKSSVSVRPKMGKININYQALYDAFSGEMKKPHLTAHGEIYFEGKEDADP